jgi:hypothetical protein
MPLAMPAAMRVRLRGVSGPIQPRNHQGLSRPRYHPWSDKLASGLWPQPCDPSSRRRSASGAPDARCRVRGVLELVQWTNSALNGRRHGLDCGLREGCVDGVRKTLETVHCPAVDWIHRFESAVLPVRHLSQNSVSDTADKVGRHIQPINLFEMRANVAVRQARRIKPPSRQIAVQSPAGQ